MAARRPRAARRASPRVAACRRASLRVAASAHTLVVLASRGMKSTMAAARASQGHTEFLPRGGVSGTEQVSGPQVGP